MAFTEGESIKNSVRNFYNKNPMSRYGLAEKLAFPKKIRGKKLLDAGCGAGYLLFDYALYGADVTGIDQSEQSINAIREQAEYFGLHPNLIVGDLEKVELPDKEFDYIFSTYVLHHTPHPEIVLAKFRRWIKDDGHARITISNKYAADNAFRLGMEGLLMYFPFVSRMVPEKFKLKVHWRDRFENPFWDPWSKRELVERVQNAGFRVDSIHYHGFTPFLTFWIPPIITKLLEKALSRYIGKAITVELSV